MADAANKALFIILQVEQKRTFVAVGDQGVGLPAPWWDRSMQKMSHTPTNNGDWQFDWEFVNLQNKEGKFGKVILLSYKYCGFQLCNINCEAVEQFTNHSH